MDKICTEKEQKRQLNAGGKASFRARMMRPEFAFETTEGPTAGAVPWEGSSQTWLMTSLAVEVFRYTGSLESGINIQSKE